MPRSKGRTRKPKPYKSKSSRKNSPTKRTRRRRSPSLQRREQERQRREQERQIQEIRIARQLENEENNRILRDIAQSIVNEGVINTVDDISSPDFDRVANDDENIYNIIYEYYRNDGEISRDDLNRLNGWLEYKLT
jgi:hypothetical protein